MLQYARDALETAKIKRLNYTNWTLTGNKTLDKLLFEYRMNLKDQYHY